MTPIVINNIWFSILTLVLLIFYVALFPFASKMNKMMKFLFIGIFGLLVVALLAFYYNWTTIGLSIDLVLVILLLALLVFTIIKGKKTEVDVPLD